MTARQRHAADAAAVKALLADLGLSAPDAIPPDEAAFAGQLVRVARSARLDPAFSAQLRARIAGGAAAPAPARSMALALVAAVIVSGMAFFGLRAQHDARVRLQLARTPAFAGNLATLALATALPLAPPAPPQPSAGTESARTPQAEPLSIPPLAGTPLPAPSSSLIP